jgi:hypothetical protein
MLSKSRHLNEPYGAFLNSFLTINVGDQVVILTPTLAFKGYTGVNEYKNRCAILQRLRYNTEKMFSSTCLRLNHDLFALYFETYIALFKNFQNN